jgi:murein DD-endopeptidase MepM/ murein hydrolase activator NlpD
MDDIAARYKYPRHNTYFKRKRRAIKAQHSTSEKLAKQIALSAVILLAVIIIKSINTPITNLMTSKISNILNKDTEFKGVYDGINNFILKFKKDDSKQEHNPQNEMVLGSSYQDELNDINEKDINQVISSIKEHYDFASPLEGTLSSSFGNRVDPFTNKLKHHNGVDIDAGQGALISSVLEGEITEVQSSKTYGKYVKIEHGNGLSTVYAHCSELIAKKGQKVSKGEVIASVGNTGLSIGSHLHFEIWKGGQALDPLCFIDFPLD